MVLPEGLEPSIIDPKSIVISISPWKQIVINQRAEQTGLLASQLVSEEDLYDFHIILLWELSSLLDCSEDHYVIIPRHESIHLFGFPFINIHMRAIYELQ